MGFFNLFSDDFMMNLMELDFEFEDDKTIALFDKDGSFITYLE